MNKGLAVNQHPLQMRRTDIKGKLILYALGIINSIVIACIMTLKHYFEVRHAT